MARIEESIVSAQSKLDEAMALPDDVEIMHYTDEDILDMYRASAEKNHKTDYKNPDKKAKKSKREKSIE